MIKLSPNFFSETFQKYSEKLPANNSYQRRAPAFYKGRVIKGALVLWHNFF